MSGPEIRALDERTVERIAAGEVVERPASVVKELLENSLDADASRVTVAVERGGIDGVRVSDDGVGMTDAQLERAVEKHTTSKIRDIGDLEGGLETLGFRGEALHAIAAVSRTTITSRPRDGDRATALTVEGGDVAEIGPAGRPPGTTVEVEDLFYNVPARRKYLKQESTEFAHVNTVTTNYALANPGVAVTLEHDGREVFATTGRGELRETVLSVYGREVASAMCPLSNANLSEGPLESIDGLVSHPETNRASREYLSTFINGRYVTATAVREAVLDAYDTQLAPDRYPFAVVFLEIDPATVDVNVHPRKLEVRFADEAAVRDQIERAVENALLDEGLVRSSAPRGRSAPEQTEIRPGTETPVPGSDDDPGPEGTADAEPDREGSAPRPVDATPSTETSREPRQDDSQSSGRQPPEADDCERTGVSDGRRRKFRESGTQDRLTGVDEDVTFDRLPAMEILGQLSETYIVAETETGLVLIDQHAADERINYERLLEAFDGEITTQVLAEPIRLELTAGETEQFEAHTRALSRLGFQAQLVESRVVEVRTVPSLVAEEAGPGLIRDVLSELVRGESGAQTVEAVVEELLADLACYPSITGNTPLTEGSVVDLLERLDACENPYACPHGRPVIVEFDADEIDERFERDYPGHS